MLFSGIRSMIAWCKVKLKPQFDWLIDWLVYLTTTFLYFAPRLTKLGRWRWYDHDYEGGLEESQKTEDTIGIHRNETRSTGSAAWRVSLETWDTQIEYIEMRPEAPGVQAH